MMDDDERSNITDNENNWVNVHNKKYEKKRINFSYDKIDSFHCRQKYAIFSHLLLLYYY